LQFDSHVLIDRAWIIQSICDRPCADVTTGSQQQLATTRDTASGFVLSAIDMFSRSLYVQRFSEILLVEMENFSRAQNSPNILTAQALCD
jgi:hypothetical protein